MRIQWNLSLRNFTIVQIAAVTFFVLLGVATYAFMHLSGHDYALGFLRLVDIGKERSFATFFSALNLLLASLLLLTLYTYEKATDSPRSRYWLLVGLLLLAMSVDEAAAIHEHFARVWKALAERGMVPFIPSHEWLPFGVAAVLIVGTVLIPFVRSLPRDTAFRFVLAGFLFVLGAVGFEALGAWMLATDFVYSSRDPIYQARRVCEEGLEMSAIALFNVTLYREVLKRDISILFNGGDL